MQLSQKHGRFAKLLVHAALRRIERESERGCIITYSGSISRFSNGKYMEYCERGIRFQWGYVHLYDTQNLIGPYCSENLKRTSNNQVLLRKALRYQIFCQFVVTDNSEFHKHCDLFTNTSEKNR